MFTNNLSKYNKVECVFHLNGLRQRVILNPATASFFNANLQFITSIASSVLVDAHLNVALVLEILINQFVKLIKLTLQTGI